MRRPSADDAAIWQRAMQGVARLSRPHQARDRDAGRLLPIINRAIAANGVDRAVGGRERTREGEADGMPPSFPHSQSPPGEFAGIDRRTAERLRRGRYPVEARLDLHGMTQPEAHRALHTFVDSARAAGKRCVLVITGHGRLSGGVLKAVVPRWLAEPELRRDILWLAPARPGHGGAGALYVLLRRADRRG
jgi:DNA-nicking Smr family endonuclease